MSRLYADNESVLCDYEEALEVLNGASDTKGSVSLQQGNIYNNSNYAGYDKKRPMNAMKKLLIMEMHMECFKRDLC